MRATVLLAALLLAGCMSVQPETPEQRLAVVDSHFTALVNTAADLRDQGVLDADDVEALDDPIQDANRALETAWRMLENDPDEAMDYVRMTNRLLLEIRAELREAQDE